MLGLGPPPAFGFEANAARPFLFVKSSEPKKGSRRGKTGRADPSERCPQCQLPRLQRCCSSPASRLKETRNRSARGSFRAKSGYFAYALCYI